MNNVFCTQYDAKIQYCYGRYVTFWMQNNDYDDVSEMAITVIMKLFYD
jgi:hypothetical protein